nr:MAG TPA: hypothetical protein [Caudoviricetes sp.]
MLFTRLVLTRVFERANDRSCADTGGGCTLTHDIPYDTQLYRSYSECILL